MRIVPALLLIGSVIFTFGCEANQSKENEIVMWLAGSETQSQAVGEVGKKFYKKTGIKVKCEAIPWGEAHSKYLTSIVGSVTPDIGIMGLTWGSEFGDLGAMIDLEESYPDDVAALKRKMFPGMWRSVEYRGRHFGIPFDMTEHILYYRNDIVKKPPETWEELESTLKELKAKDKGMLFDWGSLNWIGYSTFLWQAGGNYFDRDFSKCTLDTEEAALAMEFYAKLYNELGVSKTRIPIEQGMRTGEFPMAISGNWKIVGLTVGAPEIKGKWSIAELPKGPSGKRTAFVGGRIMGIFTNSKMKNKSWDFMKFLFEPENQVTLYEKAWESQDAYLPPNIDAWKLLPMNEELKKVLKSQAHDAQGPPPVLGWDSYSRFIDQAIQKVVLTNKNPRETLLQTTDLINKEMRKY